MKSDRVWLNWPVRFHVARYRFSWGTWFCTHGIEMCGKYTAWVFHLGPLKIIFGEDQGRRLKEQFDEGLHVGLKAEGSSRSWMLEYYFGEKGGE